MHLLKPQLAVAVLALALLAGAYALAGEYFLGQVVSPPTLADGGLGDAGSANNSTTGTPFAAALKMTVNCNAPVDYRLCTKTPCTASNSATAPDFPIPAGTSFNIDAKYNSVPVLAFIAQDGGPFVCNVYQH